MPLPHSHVIAKTKCQQLCFSFLLQFSSSYSFASAHQLIITFSLFLPLCSQFPFDGSQVRVLLYKEDESHGRRLLFDSHALQKVMLKDSSQCSSRSGGKFLKNDKFTSLQNGKIQAKAHSGNSNGSNFIEVCPEYGYKVSRAQN